MKKLDLRNSENYTKIKEAAEAIKLGGLVLFPTETVYGIGANGLDEMAVSKIFEAKGRAQDNPLILHIANIDMLDKIATDVSELEYKLMDAFWPGPFTISSKDNLDEIASNIFTLLRQVDKLKSDIVFIEGIKKENIGVAIMNRLIRACSHEYIEV